MRSIVTEWADRAAGVDSRWPKCWSRRDWPCYAAAYDAVRPRTDGIPNGVTLPNRLIEGPLTWPGQHGGFLGAGHDPWQITRDPNAPNFHDDSLLLPAGVTIERLSSRDALLRDVERQLARLEGAKTPDLPDGAAAAAENMSPADRSAMIRGMVDRLAAKLKQNGDDVDGWLRLVRAYMVLGDADKAKDAQAEARQAVSGNAERLKQLNDGFKNLGLGG